MRDVIVLSNWTWDTWNVPERIAAALAFLGSQVLYCENPVARLRKKSRGYAEGESGIHNFEPQILSHRMNRLARTAAWQAKSVAAQIVKQAHARGLRDPVFIYPHGGFYARVAAEMKRRGFFLVHVCMDYPEPGQETHVALSDLTLVIPGTAYHKLRARFGEKVSLIPQAAAFFGSELTGGVGAVPPELDRIPRPRLGYLGAEAGRLNLAVLRELLERHKEFHFLTMEPKPCLPLPNVHALPWRGRQSLPGVLAGLDAGFMPYDCSDEKNFHCVPLKIFDYFSAGLPVVSTPIVNLSEYRDVVYFGDTTAELSEALCCALRELPDSPKRRARMEIARAHAIENFAEELRRQLPLDQDGAVPVAEEKAVIRHRQEAGR